MRDAIAMKVGVPVVPGTPGPVDNFEDGASFIKEYGFPGLCYFSGFSLS
jgi:pyruvate carboxylase